MKKSFYILSYVLLAIIGVVVVGHYTSEIDRRDTLIQANAQTIEELESNLKTANEKIVRKENELSIVQKNYSDIQQNLEKKMNELEEAKKNAEYWKERFDNSDPENITYSYEFSSVKDLYAAIKSNPIAYTGQIIKIIGTIYHFDSVFDDSEAVYLYSGNSNDIPTGGGVTASAWIKEKQKLKELIEVRLLSDLQYTVLETGDYVKIYGIVVIYDGDIYLDWCECYS
jgi:hypothetical protein